MKPTNLAATRRQINVPGFDPLVFLSSQVSAVAMDGPESEKRLLQLFEDLFQHLDELSVEIEGEVAELQDTAWNMESTLFEDLDDQYHKLTEVEQDVDTTKSNFDIASEAAVRVGGRLAISDRERQNIDKSLELLSFVRFFEDAADDAFSNVLAMNSQRLRESLPSELRDQDWATISRVFHDLRVIAPWDPDVVNPTLRKAHKIVDSLASVVEIELLGQFDATLNDLMENPTNEAAITKSRDLAESLYLFNGGMALQKRYIFSVIERRIPNDAYYRQDREKGFLSKVKDLALTAQKVFKGEVNDSDDASSVGYSEGEEEAATAHPTELQKHAFHGERQEDHSLALIDLLSGLFQTINTVCVEQFALIRKIFPDSTIPQVTRSLVQRIFSDPAFGIQARVDSILCPTDEQRKLPLADYLDALLTVREKLTALNLLLLECSNDPTMRGMGSEGESLRKAKKFAMMASAPREKDIFGRGRTSSGERRSRSNTFSLHGEPEGKRRAQEDDDIDDAMRSEIEIREFFDEQIAQVLGGYVNDYFDKELLHTRGQYAVVLRKAVDDTPALGRVSGGTVMQLPALRAEKMKTIAALVKTVANKQFLNSVFALTTDAVLRMESIGRDDRKLPVTAKDLFLLHLSFLADGLMVPWARASTTMLLKICSTKAANSALPPMELLPAVAALIHGKNQVKSHFEEVIMRPLANSPNLVVVCKESRRKAFKSIITVARECLHAWTLGVAFHVEKLLSSLQSKHDYAPKFDTLNNILHAARGYAESTAACDAVCKAIIYVTNAIRNYEAQLAGIDMDTMFWKPFSSQILGNIIGHLRRQRITVDGAKMLMRDLQEYKHVMAMMSSADALDMMACLEEICTVFTIESTDVAKFVMDDLRHLDSSVVLALTRSRADFSGKGSKDPEHWSRVLSAAYMNYKWDTPLPWEQRKPFTVMSFADSLKQGNALRQLGPASLRKSAGGMSSLYKREMLRPQSTSQRPQSVAGGRKRSNSGAIALDVAALQGDDAEFHIRAAEADYEVSRQVEHLQQPRVVSKFLPSRPDDADGGAKPLAAGGSSPSVVSRPDLIMGGRTTSIAAGAGSGTARSVSVDRMSVGIAARRSSNTNTNSAGGSATTAGSAPNSLKGNPILAARNSTAGQSTGALPVTAAPAPTGAGPPGPHSMFTKMSSFFSGAATHK